jgi:hypothetical protein
VLALVRIYKKLNKMKVGTDSTWNWLNFSTGERWVVSKYDYLKVLEVLLAPKQFEKDFKRDGTYTVSIKRYNKAKELFKSLKA